MACDDVFEYPGLGLLTNELLTVGPGMFGMMQIRDVMRLSRHKICPKMYMILKKSFYKDLLVCHIFTKANQITQGYYLFV